MKQNPVFIKEIEKHRCRYSFISYSEALDMLDSYDHQNMARPKGNTATYELSYDECRAVIAKMRFGDKSELFGKEKDDSFKGSIGNIYQSFANFDRSIFI